MAQDVGMVWKYCGGSFTDAYETFVHCRFTRKLTVIVRKACNTYNYSIHVGQ